MEKQQFKAESQRLLDLMINSIYTHKEIFLREIISNASDAIDKLAYTALTDDKVGINRDEFAITITRDPENRTLTVSDNGIGMSKDEMIENLGTIAKSGSLGFKQAMEKNEDIDIIGQFGVGFYSAFMVASSITVISRKYGEDKAWKWVSDGADGYTVEETEKATPGTDVIMTLKADTEDEKYSEYLEEYEIRSLIRKYSDYIRYPIKMEVTKSRPVEEAKDENAEGEENKAPKYESYTEMETLNSMVPIWQRDKKDVTEEEYETFYRDKFFDYNKPLRTIHYNVEGNVSFKALLYIPGKAPYDFYTKDYKRGLQLYSSGVLIMDNCEDLLPEHFRFVRGVVDSQDLSLNISREMLQHNRQLTIIARNIEKKIKSELKAMLENDREKYEEFYAAFGRQLKYGTVSDYGAHKEATQDLLLFYSHKQGKLVSLKEYVDAMAEGQEKIYYAPGENKERLSKLPQVETLTKKGYDVKVLIDFISNILDSDTVTNIAVIGMGHLGQAITKYFNGRGLKLKITTAFDIDPAKVGQTIDGIPCHHMETFEEVVEDKDIDIVIVSSPSRVADELVVPIVNAGIKGVLNFTSRPLNFPRGIVVENYDITTLLEKVAYFVKENEENPTDD